MKTKYYSLINDVVIGSSYPFIAYGPVRGLISEHHTQQGAERSVERDHRTCRALPGGNSYSDASVFQYDESKGWIPVQPE